MLAAPYLKPLTRDKNPNIRFNVAEILASLGDESGYDILLSELQMTNIASEQHFAFL